MPRVFPALVVLVAAGVATAQPAPAAETPRAGAAETAGEPAHGTRGHMANVHGHEMLLRSPVTLAQAIEAAEEKAGGRTVSAGFEPDPDASSYAIEVLDRDGKLVTHHVGAETAHVIKSEYHIVANWLGRSKPDAAPTGFTGLRQAIDIAERAAGGRAAEARYEPGADGARFKVIIALDANTSRDVDVSIDGQVMPPDHSVIP